MDGRYYYLFAGVFVTVLVLVGCAGTPPVSLNKTVGDYAQKWGVTLAHGADQVEHLEELAHKGYLEDSLTIRKDALVLKISRRKDTGGLDAERFVADRSHLLESLFEPTTSPYPEVITNVIVCPSQFKPTKETVPNGVMYRLFAGERLNYGVCDASLVYYNSTYGIFNCGAKGVFELQAFNLLRASDAGRQEWVTSFHC